MSYYYNYYIGYMTPDKKIYPLGPYNSLGRLKAVRTESRNFDSGLHQDFYSVPEGQITDELRKDFQYTQWNGEIKMPSLKWLPVKDLPEGDFVKSGYFLISDVEQYEKEHDAWDLFYDSLSPTVYAQKAANEIRFGKPEPKKDEEGYEIEVHPASDYMYYAYPDYCCKEFDALLLREAANALDGFNGMPEKYELVILEDEG